MQFPKTLLALGTAALCLTTVSSRAVDTEADLKLREALRQKMAEVAPVTPPPAAPVIAAPAVTAPVVVAPAVPSAPVAAPAMPAVAAPIAVQSPSTAADEAQAERLREALRIRMQSEPVAATPPAPAVTLQGNNPTPAVSTTQSANPVAPVVISAPASSIPSSKEARLAALLQQYKGDLISPQEYHAQRAKILAE